MRAFLGMLAVAALLLACTAADEAGAPGDEAGTAASDAERAEVAGMVQRHLRGTGQIPGDVEVEVTELDESEVADLLSGVFRLSQGEKTQHVPFHLTRDLRWLFQDTPVDLSVDPVAEALGKISVGDADPYLGAADARVTIVEYSDFQCPYCARAETVVRDELLAKYGDRVRLVYKQFPLTAIHSWAQAASEIGLCALRATGNDAYWKYHTAVFAKQREIPAEGADAQLLALADEAGADGEAVRSCFEARETRAVVEATIEEARSLGVRSTPTFFVNGQRIAGAQPLEAFEALIQPALGESPS